MLEIAEVFAIEQMIEPNTFTLEHWLEPRHQEISQSQCNITWCPPFQLLALFTRAREWDRRHEEPGLCMDL
jgi:hypothetical protein